RRHISTVAGMETHFFRWNAAQSMIHRFDVLGNEFPVLLKGNTWRSIIVCNQPWVIDLYDKPGVRYGLVLLAHRVGDCEQVFLLSLVIFICKVTLNVRRRQCRNESLLRWRLFECQPEILDIGLNVRVADIGYRSGAIERHSVRRLRTAKPAGAAVIHPFQILVSAGKGERVL